MEDRHTSVPPQGGKLLVPISGASWWDGKSLEGVPGFETKVSTSWRWETCMGVGEALLWGCVGPQFGVGGSHVLCELEGSTKKKRFWVLAKPYSKIWIGVPEIMLKWDWELGLGVGELGLLGFVYGHGILGYKDV